MFQGQVLSCRCSRPPFGDPVNCERLRSLSQFPARELFHPVFGPTPGSTGRPTRSAGHPAFRNWNLIQERSRPQLRKRRFETSKRPVFKSMLQNWHEGGPEINCPHNKRRSKGAPRLPGASTPIRLACAERRCGYFCNNPDREIAETWTPDGDRHGIVLDTTFARSAIAGQQGEVAEWSKAPAC